MGTPDHRRRRRGFRWAAERPLPVVQRDFASLSQFWIVVSVGSKSFNSKHAWELKVLDVAEVFWSGGI